MHKGAILAPFEAKKRCFYTYFLFIRILALVYNSCINLTFTVAIVTKMTTKLGLKSDHFGANFETFDRDIHVE